MAKTGKLLVVQGAQWGSEGKGQVAALLAEREADCAVRTGSINAGHTVTFEEKQYKMQLVPTAWVVRGMPLYIGPGAYIEQDILDREVAEVSAALGEDIRKRLFIDSRCFIHSSEAKSKAKEANRHVEMGATGKGSSEAVIQKLRSRGDFEQAESLKFSNSTRNEGYNLCDVPAMLMDHYKKGDVILFEGTQGSLLDLHVGPHPFVTNRSCNAATWIQEAGLSPALNTEVVFVARTFPIRVAGNSGPMPNETTWPEMWNTWNRHLCTDYVDPISIHNYQCIMDARFEQSISKLNELQLALTDIPTSYQPHKFTEDQRRVFKEELSNVPMDAWKSLSDADQENLRPFIEMTTVTKKPRRISKFDLNSYRQACLWNAPNRVFLGFANYLDPKLWGSTDLEDVKKSAVVGKLAEILQMEGTPVFGVSTGPNPEHHLFV